MPKYTDYRINNYYLYFTSQCVVEAMHVHARKNMNKKGSAKIWVGKNGETKIQSRGSVSKKDLIDICEYIHANYMDMYMKWKKYSDNGFYDNV